MIYRSNSTACGVTALFGIKPRCIVILKLNLNLKELALYYVPTDSFFNCSAKDSSATVVAKMGNGLGKLTSSPIIQMLLKYFVSILCSCAWGSVVKSTKSVLKF